ncbi:MAG TPA: hypothetical protein VMC85_03870 [Desulfomonilaceae bacterium]|nr:hypothetical protein [Desulfomonilaceae bacterium]
MSDIAAMASVLDLLGLGGLGLFIYFVVKGMRERIGNLTQLANEQKVTLDAVRERALEMDKLSKDYKQALTDFQDMGKKLDERRNELVKELELAIKRKDDDLERLTKLRLEEIEVQKKSLERIPGLEQLLEQTVSELTRQFRILSPSRWSLLSPPRRSRWELGDRPDILNYIVARNLTLGWASYKGLAEPDSGSEAIEEDDSELQKQKDKSS